MSKMTKSEFMKKFINDYYEEKQMKRKQEQQIAAYQFNIINKNRFKG